MEISCETHLQTGTCSTHAGDLCGEKKSGHRFEDEYSPQQEADACVPPIGVRDFKTAKSHEEGERGSTAGEIESGEESGPEGDSIVMPADGVFSVSVEGMGRKQWKLKLCGSLIELTRGTREKKYLSLESVVSFLSVVSNAPVEPSTFTAQCVHIVRKSKKRLRLKYLNMRLDSSGERDALVILMNTAIRAGFPARPRSVLVIINGGSGDGKGKQMYDRYVKKTLSVAHIQTEVCETRCVEDISKYAQKLKEEHEGLIVVGGDGTMFSVLRGLVMRHINRKPPVSGRIAGTTSGTGLDPGTTSGPEPDSGTTSGTGLDPGITSGTGLDSGTTSGMGLDPGITSGTGLDSGTTSGTGLDPGTSSGGGGDQNSEPSASAMYEALGEVGVFPVPIAIIPAGTGNGIAGSTCDKDPLTAALLLVLGYTIDFPVGAATESSKDSTPTHFLGCTATVFSYGFFSDFINYTESNRSMGKLRYLSGMFKGIRTRSKGFRARLQSVTADHLNHTDSGDVRWLEGPSGEYDNWGGSTLISLDAHTKSSENSTSGIKFRGHDGDSDTTNDTNDGQTSATAASSGKLKSGSLTADPLKFDPLSGWMKSFPCNYNRDEKFAFDQEDWHWDDIKVTWEVEDGSVFRNFCLHGPQCCTQTVKKSVHVGSPKPFPVNVQLWNKCSRPQRIVNVYRMFGDKEVDPAHVSVVRGCEFELICTENNDYAKVFDLDGEAVPLKCDSEGQRSREGNLRGQGSGEDDLQGQGGSPPRIRVRFYSGVLRLFSGSLATWGLKP